MIGTISRRSLLGGIGSLVGSALLAPVLGPAEAAPANAYALAPKFTANWRVHKTFKGAKVNQLSAGVKIITSRKPKQADVSQVGLWAIKPVQGDFEFSFTYKVTYRVAVSGGSFGTFYFDTTGKGTSRYPAAMPNWVGITPSDQNYALNARGLRFSFATYNPSNPDIHQKLRLRHFNQSSPVLVGEASPQVFPFTTGRAYGVRVRRVGQKLDVLVTDTVTKATQSFGWDDPRINGFGGGYVGFRWRSQEAQVTNAKLVTPAPVA